MADDVILPGTGSIVKTIEKTGGEHVQLVALDIGATTTSAIVVAGQAAMAASVPVAIASNQSAIPTSDNGPAWTPAYLHTASADVTGIVDVTAAPTSGQKIVIDDIVVSVGAAMTLTFEDETAGTDLLVLYMAANSTVQVTPRGRIKLPVADKKLRMDSSAAGAVAVTVCYHSEA